MAFTLGYKVNENTDYEFTVSDETIQEIIQGDGITESDIADYCYTALHDSRINALHVESSSAWSYGPSEFDGWVEDDCVFRLFRGIPIPTLNKGLNEPVTDVYERNLLTWNGTIYPGTENEKTGTFLVMDMKDIKKWYAEYTTTMFSQTSVASTATKYGQTSTAPGYTGDCYAYISNTVVNYSIEPAEEMEVDGTLRFLNVFVLNDELWVGLLNPSSHGEAQTMHSVNSWYNGGNNFVKGYLNVNDPSDKLFQRGTTGYYGVSLIPDLVYESAVDTDLQTYPEGSNGIIMYGNCANSQINLYSGDYAKDLDTVLTWQSWCGIKFKYDNTMYKPIIESGVIIGYTDDMTVPSEYDDMTNVTGNNISPTPPGPTPPGPGPYDDDPWSGVSFSGVGVGGAGAFAKCYYMTSTELANLRSWMNSNNVPEGFDPMAQIIGLSQVPVSLSGDDNSTVQFVNSSAVYDPGVTRLVDSGVTTQIAMGTPIRYSLGSVDITRRMQERGEPYLDYDCQIELYLPLIGMFSLDTQAVMGRTITAEAVLDPISGTLAAYAYVSRDGQNLPIAYGSTTIGVDLPISAQQYSVSRAALKQANAQLGASILSSTLSFIAAATAGGKGSGTGAKTATGTNNGLAAAGIREAGADYMKASQAGNVFGDFMQWGRTIRQLSYGNNTAIAGSFGGSTAQWSYPFTPYVKIIRPRYEKPSNYNHSQGVPCVQTKKVGSCTGFIQCIGVDVSGITRATDLERQAIQAALANGVFAGGGS